MPRNNTKSMDKNRLKKECMGIVNQLFDLAEVSVEKRQAINDRADKYVQKQFLRLFAVSGAKRKICPVCKKTFVKGWGEFCSQDCWDTDM